MTKEDKKHWESEPIEMDRYEAAKEVEARGLAMLKLAHELRFGEEGLALLMKARSLLKQGIYAEGMCMCSDGYFEEALECIDAFLGVDNVRD